MLTWAAEILGRLGFDDAMKTKKAKNLSGGEKQRVAIGRSLMQDAKVVLLDEPFTSLDTLKRKELISLLRELTARFGTTFVIVSHDIEETLYAAEQVHCLLSPRANPQLQEMDWNAANLATNAEAAELYTLIRTRAEHIIKILGRDTARGDDDAK